MEYRVTVYTGTDKQRHTFKQPPRVGEVVLLDGREMKIAAIRHNLVSGRTEVVCGEDAPKPARRGKQSQSAANE